MELDKMPLMIACELGQTQVVLDLLEQNDIDIQAINTDTPYKSTALRYAINGNHKEIVDVLFKHPRLSTSDDHLAMLYYAKIGDLARLKMCLDPDGTRMCNVNFRDGEYETALTNATENNHIELVKFLLVQGADANKPTCLKETVLIIAVRKGLIELVDLLLPHTNLHVQSYTWGTALTAAVYFQRYELVQKLLGKEGKFLDSKHPGAFLFAVKNNDAKMIELLLEYGANVNSDGGDGYQSPPRYFWQDDQSTPFRCYGPRLFVPPVILALRENKLAVLPLLLINGANLDKEGEGGKTARMMLNFPSISVEAKNIVYDFLKK